MSAHESLLDSGGSLTHSLDKMESKQRVGLVTT